MSLRTRPQRVVYTDAVLNLDVDVPTADGVAAASLHLPEGPGPWPGVILYPDAGGTREVFREMGARLAGAGHGYVVLVPDINYRTGGYESFSMDTVFSDPTSASASATS